MLFIAHSGATAINAGKVYFTKNPMAINYSQWIAFAKYSYKQLKWVVVEKPLAREAYVAGKLEDSWKKLEMEMSLSRNFQKIIMWFSSKQALNCCRKVEKWQFDKRRIKKEMMSWIIRVFFIQ